ncbi:lasso peptide biosynthesis B2 protein [Novosphingobium sp. ZN18A2]|uniref:lasso peptide biosynthesis B2 protein n=1 Tax=Novosphingobium sp. ZN18A2 TaxID=3079861 RepID=UPI0030D2174B
MKAGMGIPATWTDADGNARWRAAASPRFWLAAGRALLELLRARIALSRLDVADIERLNDASARKGRQAGQGGRADAQVANLVGFVVPRIARRVPWRSDCLVQAMAARRWMLSRGIATRIAIGVDKPAPGDFESHAWLLHGDAIVTGGDIRRYHPMVGHAPADDPGAGDPGAAGQRGTRCDPAD